MGILSCLRVHWMRSAGAICGVLALVVGGSAAVQRAHATPPPPFIPGLTATASANTGFSVAVPDSSTVPLVVGQSTAIQRIPQLDTGSKVLQVVLADVTDSQNDPTMHCLCYVVSITPKAAPSGSPAGFQPSYVPAPSFTVELVDAVTGKWIGEVGGN